MHLRCAGIRLAQYTYTWTCNKHRESSLTTHTDITPPSLTRRTFTNYKKADCTQFTEDTESAFAQTTIPTNIYTGNRICTNIILMANKDNIPKGKMHSNCRLLPDHIVCKITQRNNIRRANTCDPLLKLLNEEITSDIQKHKQNMERGERIGVWALPTLWEQGECWTCVCVLVAVV